MGFLRTSTGLRRRRVRFAAEGFRSGRRPALVGVLALAIAGWFGMSAEAGSQGAKLLPAEDAFRFSARPLDAKTVEARFTVAEGYYLYREKLRFTATPALGLVVPKLPPGEIKEDEFFGRVETYRREVLVRLVLPEAAPGVSVVLAAESQGCADAGVCYPPNIQRVTLAMPAPGVAPAPFIDANAPRKKWFN